MANESCTHNTLLLNELYSQDKDCEGSRLARRETDATQCNRDIWQPFRKDHPPTSHQGDTAVDANGPVEDLGVEPVTPSIQQFNTVMKSRLLKVGDTIKRQQLSLEEVTEIFQSRPDIRKVSTGERLRKVFMSESKLIAPKYGVTSKTIRDIWRAHTWGQVTCDLWSEEDKVHYAQLIEKSKPTHASAAASSANANSTLGSAQENSARQEGAWPASTTFPKGLSSDIVSCTSGNSEGSDRRSPHVQNLLNNSALAEQSAGPLAMFLPPTSYFASSWNAVHPQCCTTDNPFANRGGSTSALSLARSRALANLHNSAPVSFEPPYGACLPVSAGRFQLDMSHPAAHNGGIHDIPSSMWMQHAYNQQLQHQYSSMYHQAAIHALGNPIHSFPFNESGTCASQLIMASPFMSGSSAVNSSTQSLAALYMPVMHTSSSSGPSAPGRNTSTGNADFVNPANGGSGSHRQNINQQDDPSPSQGSRK